MKKNGLVVFALLLLGALICGCPLKKDEKSENVSDVTTTSFESKKSQKKKPSEFKLLSLGNEKTGNAAHKKYLDDEMKFVDLPERKFETETRTYVVGGNGCCLYEEIPLPTQEDVSNLVKITDVPKGTILIAAGDPIKAPEKYGANLFYFCEAGNYFYPVEYEGKRGLVFGAFLATDGDHVVSKNTRTNEKFSFLYSTAGKNNLAHFDEFYPICGYLQLGDDVKEALELNRIAFQDVKTYEYELSVSRPDDMVSLYQGHDEAPYGFYMGNNLIPLFITTDLFAHSQHLVFDRLLMKIEEQTFIKSIGNVSSAFIGKISADLVNNPENETLQKAKMFFEVGLALSELAPEYKVSNDWRREETWTPKNKDNVLSKYNEDVKADVESILAQSGEVSKVFSFSDGTSYKENFSIYIPRGHYTNNELLRYYFRAMTWYGRINFPIVEDFKGDATLAKKMAPIALYITDLASKDKKLLESWKSLFEPMTALIGKSDDLSFNDLIPLWKSLNVDNAIEWVSDENNIKQFSEFAKEKLEGPMIADRKQDDVAMGWRLFGQRFTYDAFIFDSLSDPRLSGRPMVSGLDVAASFGSKTAEGLLEDEFQIYPEMKPKIDEFKKFFDEKDERFWSETYYNTVLSLTKAQANFEQGTGFYFTETPLWNIKALESSLANWAELKHDTLLYTKQSFAEKGGGEEEATFLVDKLPSPVHYIEPNLKFFIYFYNSWNVLKGVFDDYNLFAASSKTNEEANAAINSMLTISEKAIEIVRSEALDKEVSVDELKWIANIPNLLSKVVFPFKNSAGAISANSDQFKMALVADIFTNEESGEILEVAVGIPQRIYVALNDAQGGKRIAVGYKHNYCEFNNGERLTDEDWKLKVYNSYESIDDYKPEWCKGFSLDATGFGN